MEAPAPAAQGSSRKRKERDAASPPAGPPEPASAPTCNWLLAGQLAHEFLSRGTLLGVPVPGVVFLGERRAPGPEAAAATGGAARDDAAAVPVQNGGASVPGVVNGEPHPARVVDRDVSPGGGGASAGGPRGA